jgi:hypothetical protein
MNRHEIAMKTHGMDEQEENPQTVTFFKHSLLVALELKEIMMQRGAKPSLPFRKGANPFRDLVMLVIVGLIHRTTHKMRREARHI